jgi:hypothetical protein
MRGPQVLCGARPRVGPSSQAFASALTERTQKITEGDCAGIAGDGLQQQAWRAVLGILRQVDGGGPVSLSARRLISAASFCPSAPIRKARCDKNFRPCGRQQVGNLFWARNVVVDEQPSRALFGKSAQRSFCRLLNISFFCCRRTQSDSKPRKGAQETRACFGRTPTNARIQTSEALRPRCQLNLDRRAARTDRAEGRPRSAG